MIAYTYNFAKFIAWPRSAFSGAHSPLTLCLVGDHPFGIRSLSYLDKRSVRERPVSIRRYPRVGDLAECHIVFVGRSEALRLEGLLADLDGQPILTVSDIPGFVQRGGMIEFMDAGSRLRFDIDADAVREARLTISAKLLEVAEALARRSSRGN